MISKFSDYDSLQEKLKGSEGNILPEYIIAIDGISAFKLSSNKF
jgi:hypothetical protein